MTTKRHPVSAPNHPELLLGGVTRGGGRSRGRCGGHVDGRTCVLQMMRCEKAGCLLWREECMPDLGKSDDIRDEVSRRVGIEPLPGWLLCKQRGV